MKLLKWAYRFFGSLKFAVFVIVAMAIISSVGTIIESKYNAEIAQLLVYKSVYMYVVMFALCLSLILSAIHRIPWKKKHIPFLVAHIGLLILLYGSWLTMEFGVDGSMVLGANKSNQWVSLPQKQVTIYASKDGNSFTSLYQEFVEFYTNKPNISLELPEGELKINDYKPFVLRNAKVGASEEKMHGPAVRFILSNPNVNFSEWLLHNGKRDAVLNLGPAKILLTTNKNSSLDGNTIVLRPKTKDSLSYEVHYKDNKKKTKVGVIKEGQSIETGWMGLEFQLIRYHPKAKETVDYVFRDYPNELTSEIIQVEFQGKRHWVEMNSLFRLFTEQTAYYIAYGNRQIDIGVPLKLIDFQLGKYPGTNRPASYASLVSTPGLEDTLISMNEPLKYKGYTFYQSSYQKGPTGEPVASVLSVNYDPGRFWKYLGSLFVVFGCVLLFYFRKYYMKKVG